MPTVHTAIVLESHDCSANVVLHGRVAFFESTLFLNPENILLIAFYTQKNHTGQAYQQLWREK